MYVHTKTLSTESAANSTSICILYQLPPLILVPVVVLFPKPPTNERTGCKAALLLGRGGASRNERPDPMARPDSPIEVVGTLNDITCVVMVCHVSLACIFE